VIEFTDDLSRPPHPGAFTPITIGVYSLSMDVTERNPKPWSPLQTDRRREIAAQGDLWAAPLFFSKPADHASLPASRLGD